MTVYEFITKYVNDENEANDYLDELIHNEG